MRKKTIHHISHTLLSGALLLSLASCINDNYLDEVAYTDGKVAVEMSIQARSLSNNIKSSSGEQYVAGTEWENYIDIAGGDYRVYFFTYDPTTETESGKGTNSTLIAEFKPTDLFSTDFGTYTSYTMSGEVDESLISSLNNFKVVVLANWGVNNYPTVTTSTTIGDICNAQTAVFNAFVDATTGSALMPSSSLHIPFFGVHEYSNVEWTANRKTYLSDYSSDNDNGTITLLRSVAKVEVILDAESDVSSFDDVSLVNYNAQGYCAPTGVYLKSDYDHDYTWSEDFVDDLHIVGGANDATSKTMSMQQTAATATTQETWTCYLTEYDNTSTGTDYSYISVKINDEQYQIHFSNYSEGSTTSNADYDIYRNYLYRFHVTYAGGYFRVHVDKWDDKYTNVFDFDSDYEASDSGDGGDGGDGDEP